MRKTVIVLLALALIAGGFFAWLKWSPSDYLDGYYLVPSNAALIVETEDPVGSWQKFSASEMWQGMKGFPAFAKITKKADFLDDVIQSNQQVFSLLGKKHLLISLHMISDKDFDFVYYADMKEASKSGLIKASLTSLIRQFDYVHTVREYNGVEVNEFKDPESRDVLSLAFLKNYLVCSYNKTLMNSVIETSSNPHVQTGMDPHFTEANRLTSDDGLCRIFINYSSFDRYLGVYMDDLSDVKNLFSGLYFTGMDTRLEEERLTSDGYTMLNDSLSSYLQALSVSGNAIAGSDKIFSDRSAFYMSMCFPDFNTFYGNLDRKLAQNPSYKEQQANLSKIEKKLGISFKKNIFAWIGTEVALARYESDLPAGSKSGSVMVIRTSDMDVARENLETIEKQIRKRTPVKFNDVEYNGYLIKYLEVKGLFRAFLGKLFAKLDKPYYTIIADYVVFSDDPRLLLQTIDDFRAQRTLANQDDYRDFRSGFPEKTSAMVYLSPDRYFPLFRDLLNPESLKSSLKNQAYIRCFSHAGLGLTGDGNRMRTVFSAQYKKWEPAIMVQDTADFESDTLTALELFLIRHFQNNMNTQVYENGKPRVTAEMSGNIYHGAYAEYYENGVLKVRGKYKNGVKNGIWKYYKPDGTFDYKEKYVEGMLKRRGLLERVFGGGEE